MVTERTSLMPSQPWFGQLALRRRGELPPAIVAPRDEIVDEQVGRLSYYSNVGAAGVPWHEPALVLIHDTHVGASSHEVRHLFDLLRDQRPVYALDLPGFGHSECKAALGPDLYVAAVERMLRVAAQHTGRPVDVLAVALSAEFAAKVAAQRPALVRSLLLLEPTGFASEWERSAFETAARQGKAMRGLTLARRLGLASLLYGTLSSRLSMRYLLRRASQPADELRYARDAAQRPGAERAALACLEGSLFPRENPQAIYTHVHCPTLILTSASSPRRYGQLARFVKWREHFVSEQLPRLDLTTRLGSAQVAEALYGFLSEHELRASQVAQLPRALSAG
jgi:pimeloyl-ACP methyl ester carboxylesterase